MFGIGVILLKKLHPGHMPKAGTHRGVQERDTTLPIESQYLDALSQGDVASIVGTIRRERLAAYIDVTQSDVQALALYELNARLSNCLHEVIGGLEVALRNAVSEAIKDHYQRDDWYRARAFTSLLAPERRQNIRDVRARLGAQRQEVRSGRVVAGLTFHFWVAMHENKYRDTIWTPFLRKLWPDGENIKHVHKDLLKIRDLRNRIAHHEPIFSQRWRNRSDIVWLRLEQLSPPKHAWFENRVKSPLDSLNANFDELGV